MIFGSEGMAGGEGGDKGTRTEMMASVLGFRRLAQGCADPTERCSDGHRITAFLYLFQPGPGFTNPR